MDREQVITRLVRQAVQKGAQGAVGAPRRSCEPAWGSEQVSPGPEMSLKRLAAVSQIRRGGPFRQREEHGRKCGDRSSVLLSE